MCYRMKGLKQCLAQPSNRMMQAFQHTYHHSGLITRWRVHECVHIWFNNHSWSASDKGTMDYH